MIQTMLQLLQLAQEGEPGRLAVACAQDEYVLEAVGEATKLGIVQPILVGDEGEIRAIVEKHQPALADAVIVSQPDKAQACITAARLVRDGVANVLTTVMVAVIERILCYGQW